MDQPLTKVLTRSSNARLIKIDNTNGIIQYDYGALIDQYGEENGKSLMIEFCSQMTITVLVEGERPSGEKQWTKTTVFKCN